jgi:hypothetical protein
VLTIRLPIPANPMAFSSEADAASREESASEQQAGASVLMQSEPRL